MSSGYGGNSYGGNSYGGTHNQQQHYYNDVQMTDASNTSSHNKREEESDDDDDWDLDENDFFGEGGIVDGLGGANVGYGNINPTDPKAAEEKKKTFQITRKDTSEKRSSTGKSKDKRKSTVITRPLASAEKMGKKGKKKK